VQGSLGFVNEIFRRYLVSGIGSFQLNSLIAAAAGTYAGTLARKATQHVFLLELM